MSDTPPPGPGDAAAPRPQSATPAAWSELAADAEASTVDAESAAEAVAGAEADSTAVDSSAEHREDPGGHGRRRSAVDLAQLLNPEPDQPAPLQVDTEAYADADADSTYGSEAHSAYTGSVTSSIFDYQYENGRRYHAYREGQYVLPNDAQEQERLDLQHHIWRLLLGGRLYTAPLSGPDLRILDLGTGTGIWAIDMADEFPSASVAGVDLSPIQPDWVPNNCHFHVDDYEDEWTYRDDERFDYIHGRALCGTSSDWPRFYGRVMHHLRPGGWVEMQEYDAWIFSDDDSFDRAPWTKEWVSKLSAASNMYGKPINIARFHKRWMLEAGFEQVREVVHRIPIGPWAKDPALKEVGRFELVHMQMSVDSHTPALFTRVLNYSPDQARILMEGVKREFRNRDLRLITSYRFITGRKPEACL